MNEVQEPITSPRPRSRIPLIVSAVALVVLVVMSFLLWLEISKRFPKFPTGLYAGEITGLWPEQTRVYLEQLPKNLEMLVVVLRDGWKPQIIVGALAGSRTDLGEELLPIQIGSKTDTLQFIGEAKGTRFFFGKVSDRLGNQGEWYMRPVDKEQELPAEPSLASLRLWLLLKAEIQDVDSQIKSAEAKVPTQRAEIEKLTGFITEGERLKNKAGEKLNAVKEELKAQQELQRKKQEEAKRVEETLVVSQKVSGQGKLVALSRESLEREGRWVDSMLRTGGVSMNRELSIAVEKAEKISALQREIALEKKRLEELTGMKEKEKANAEMSQ